MTKITVYSEEGVITTSGDFSDSTVAMYRRLFPGNLVEGFEGDAKTHYVDLATKIVNSYTAEEQEAIVSLPSGWKWQMPEKVAVDLRSLEIAKEQAWNLVKSARDKATAKPFEVDGKFYDANKENVLGTALMALMAKIAGEPFNAEWTTYDNSVVVLNADQMINVGKTLGERVDLIYKIGRDLREKITSAKTNQELSLLTWPSNL
jgi:hypothetical protein